MKIKLLITDDVGNVIGISSFETDVVDANGDMITAQAFLDAMRDWVLKDISTEHNAPVEERHTRLT